MGERVRLPLVASSRPERADAARNRQALLHAAAEIVREQGVACLSMEATAARAGVGVGTVYRRFTDRAGLAYALMDEQERQFQEAFLSGPPPLGPGPPPADRLRAYLHAYLDRLVGQAELMAVAELRHRYGSAAYRLQRSHVATLIRAIKPDLDASYLADALLAALSSTLYLHQITEEQMPTERIRAGLDQLIRGILC